MPPTLASSTLLEISAFWDMEINTASVALRRRVLFRMGVGAVARLEGNPAASVILHAVAFDERARGVEVVPDAVAVRCDGRNCCGTSRLPTRCPPSVPGRYRRSRCRRMSCYWRARPRSRRPAGPDSGMTGSGPRCGGCNCS